MAKDHDKKLVDALMKRYGCTYAESIGIDIEKNTPAPLFQLLCASMLYSARISANSATRAMRALIVAGLTTPQKMAEASWQRRVDVITWHGYKRYDERTSTMLGEAAQMVLERYHGDLRKLREEAEEDVEQEKALLQEFKGIGSTGADIFLREVQIAWKEVYPFADDKVLDAAEELGLPRDVVSLAELTTRKQFPRLVAALVRVDLDHAYEEIREAS